MAVAARKWIESLKERFPDCFEHRKVLECGAHFISTDVKQYFSDIVEYVGVDWRAGENVNRVCLIHDYKDKPDGYFDTVISISLIEHDPYWKKSIKRMLDLLSFGGTLILTYPGPRNAPHLTDTSPKEGYYKSIPMQEIIEFILLRESFHTIITESHANVHDDVYLFFDGKGKKGLG